MADLKVAVSYPTTIQLVEKLGPIFKEMHLIGFSGEHSKTERYHNGEFDAMGIKIHYHPEPYEDISPLDYDLLIDSWETRYYNEAWRQESLKWKIPTIMKVLWFAYPKDQANLTEEEIDKFNHCLVSTENFTLQERWKAAGMEHLRMLLYPAGKWWFDTPWKGNVNRLLYILSGVGDFRDTVSTGYEMWKDVEKALSGRTYHQDGSKFYMTSQDLARLTKAHRCYVNLDNGADARPLCLVFTEAVAAGIPPIILRQETTDYARYIKDGVSGFICDDVQDVINKARVLLDCEGLAQSMSAEITKTGKEHFSEEALKPEWDDAVKQAQNLA